MNFNYITGLVPTFNNEETIAKTLESLNWLDKLLVVDSYSTDGTVAIAKNLGAKVVQHEYVNSAKQKNWALQFIDTEWVLQLDTDEILESGAEDEIRAAVSEAPENTHCLRLRRKNHMWSKWLRFGGIYPDYENRVFRAKKGSWFDREVHSNVRVKGEYAVLDANIIHYGMPNISKQVKNLDRYTRYEADELLKKGKKPSLLKWLFFPWLVFGYRYFYQQGFRDGWHGLFLAIYAAFYYFLSQSKLKEIYVLNLKKSP